MSNPKPNPNAFFGPVSPIPGKDLDARDGVEASAGATSMQIGGAVAPEFECGLDLGLVMVHGVSKLDASQLKAFLKEMAAIEGGGCLKLESGKIRCITPETEIPTGTLVVLDYTEMDSDDSRERLVLAGEVGRIEGFCDGYFDLTFPASGAWIRPTKTDLVKSGLIFEPADKSGTNPIHELLGIPGVSEALRRGAGRYAPSEEMVLTLKQVREFLSDDHRFHCQHYTYLPSAEGPYEDASDCFKGNDSIVVQFKMHEELRERLERLSERGIQLTGVVDGSDGEYLDLTFSMGGVEGDGRDQEAFLNRVMADLGTLFPERWVVRDGHGRQDVVSSDLLAMARELTGDNAALDRIAFSLKSLSIGEEMEQAGIQDELVAYLIDRGFEVSSFDGGLAISRQEYEQPNAAERRESFLLAGGGETSSPTVAEAEAVMEHLRGNDGFRKPDAILAILENTASSRWRGFALRQVFFEGDGQPAEGAQVLEPLRAVLAAGVAPEELFLHASVRGLRQTRKIQEDLEKAMSENAEFPGNSLQGVSRGLDNVAAQAVHAAEWLSVMAMSRTTDPEPYADERQLKVERVLLGTPRKTQ